MRYASMVLAAVLIPTAVMAQKPPSLAALIKGELLNKAFRTKIVVGNALILPDRPPTDSVRLVDTNVHPNGRVEYNLRSGFLLGDLRSVVARTCGAAQSHPWREPIPTGRLCEVKAGTAVRVWQVDVNDDRIEVWMEADGGFYAKLKFMFGRGWQKTMSLSQVMEGVSAGLWIESIERVKAVEREYTDLRRQSAGVSFNATDPAETRIQQAERLRDILSRLITNRTQYQSFGKGLDAAETNGYAASIKELDGEIVRSRAEVRATQVTRLKNEYAAAAATAIELRAATGGLLPRTMQGLKERRDLISQWEATVQSREKTLQQLVDLGEPGLAGSDAGRTAEIEEIRKRRAEVSALEPKLVLVDLNDQYTRMRPDENRLKAAYVSAFETPRQVEAASRWRSHMLAMIANREAALKAGDPSAAKEIQRLRGVLGSIR